MAVCDAHDLGPRTTFGFSHFFYHPGVYPVVESRYGPYRVGRSFHGVPVRRIHKYSIENLLWGWPKNSSQ